jgi:PIN domain nuclease of toxin-antitoxin system
MDDAPAHGDHIGISSITFVEVVYLAEKGRIDAGTFVALLADLKRSDTTFAEIPVDWRVGQAMQSVPRSEVPDMPDRIIASTAVAFNVPVISRDGKIKLSRVSTIW